MTDRDTFAAAALTGLLHGIPDGTDIEAGAAAAYSVADAMLRERGNYSEKPNSSPTLTDAEREAMATAAIACEGIGFVEMPATLRSLLERLA